MSKLTREQIDQIINEHFGYEARKDIDGVVGTLTEDVDHDVVGFPGSQVKDVKLRGSFIRGSSPC